MMYRNLAAMTVEETMRAQPIDGVVLMVGCDKTTPSLIMGAASTDLPSIVVTGGPMLNGWFRGRTRRGRYTPVAFFRGRESRGNDARRLHRSRSRGDALIRHMQHHGHSLVDGEHDRSSWHGSVGQRGHPSRGFTPPRDGPNDRATDRSDGKGRSETFRHHDPASF